MLSKKQIIDYLNKSDSMAFIQYYYDGTVSITTSQRVYELCKELSASSAGNDDIYVDSSFCETWYAESIETVNNIIKIKFISDLNKYILEEFNEITKTV